MKTPYLILINICSTLFAYAQEDNILINIDSTEQMGDYEIIDPVEKMAEFPGGVDSLRWYLKENNKWKVGKETITGKAFVAFVVETDGNITNVEIAKSLHEKCDEEAIRLVKNMPNWKPAEFRGKPVRMQMVIPITFDGLE